MESIAARQAREKVGNPVTPSMQRPAAPPPQLFDLKYDPFERVDLAAAHPERVSRMTSELAAWFEDVELDRRRAIESES